MGRTKEGTMPKAMIIGDTITLDDYAEPLTTKLSLHIGWDNGMPAGGVKLGIRGVDPETDEPNMSSVFITLDWAAINRAIIKLREARDGTYGRPA